MKKDVKKSIKSFGRVVEKMRKVEDKILLTNKPFKAHSTTFGQKAADWLTTWAGSWTFIILVAIFLFIWMSINTAWIIFGRAWDPYPFILLNFILSTVAAMQAPIILMSQNRTSQKDRARAEYDYAVNKKAEREIRGLKDQLDRIERKLRRK